MSIKGIVLNLVALIGMSLQLDAFSSYTLLQSSDGKKKVLIYGDVEIKMGNTVVSEFFLQSLQSFDKQQGLYPQKLTFVYEYFDCAYQDLSESKIMLKKKTNSLKGVNFLPFDSNGTHCAILKIFLSLMRHALYQGQDVFVKIDSLPIEDCPQGYDILTRDRLLEIIGSIESDVQGLSLGEEGQELLEELKERFTRNTQRLTQFFEGMNQGETLIQFLKYFYKDGRMKTLHDYRRVYRAIYLIIEQVISPYREIKWMSRILEQMRLDDRACFVVPETISTNVVNHLKKLGYKSLASAHCIKEVAPFVHSGTHLQEFVSDLAIIYLALVTRNNDEDWFTKKLVYKSDAIVMCSVCLKKTDNTVCFCDQCQYKYYCSKQCKQLDWQWHKEECQINKSENFAASSSSAQERIGCWGCDKHDAELQKCSRCHKAQYCSKECQVIDWKKRHKNECAPKASNSQS